MPEAEQAKTAKPWRRRATVRALIAVVSGIVFFGLGEFLISAAHPTGTLGHGPPPPPSPAPETIVGLTLMVSFGSLVVSAGSAISTAIIGWRAERREQREFEERQTQEAARRAVRQKRPRSRPPRDG